MERIEYESADRRIISYISENGIEELEIPLPTGIMTAPQRTSPESGLVAKSELED